MGVYTDVTQDELKRFIGRFAIGDVVACTAIPQGIENSNFLLVTTTGKFVLTIYERRVDPNDLPFFLGLMHFLSDNGFHCPRPLSNIKGEYLQTLAGKPAALVSFLNGASPHEITRTHCNKLGSALAKMHLIASKYPLSRANNLALPAWSKIFSELKTQSDKLKPGLSDWIQGELSSLDGCWPTNLPTGIIHGDLFPDNVFFSPNNLPAFIDFYFACNDAYAFDIAICLNSWCFDSNQQFDRYFSQSLFDGYQSVRPLSRLELVSMPLLARGAAMRFLITRLYDWFNVRKNTPTQRKNPLEFLPVIEFHQTVVDSAAYGVG
ncbi:MAG: homoserine kinase [Pseudomonadota bacterium]|nr:homoserine kinase [Pseudomonadota bacterium]